MRLFVSLPVPAELRRAIAQPAERLRARLPKARWEAAEKLHLTLAFLGEVDAARLPELTAALRDAVADRPVLSLALGPAGAFPTPQRARVVWLAVAEPSGALAALQAAVAEATRRFAERADERRFHAHLTLARCDPAWPRAACEGLAAGLADLAGRSWTARSLALMESELQRGGARHREVAAFDLGAAP